MIQLYDVVTMIDKSYFDHTVFMLIHDSNTYSSTTITAVTKNHCAVFVLRLAFPVESNTVLHKTTKARIIINILAVVYGWDCRYHEMGAFSSTIFTWQAEPGAESLPWRWAYSGFRVPMGFKVYRIISSAVKGRIQKRHAWGGANIIGFLCMR